MRGLKLSRGQVTIAASGFAAAVLSAWCYLGPGTPSTRAWNAAPLFTYATLIAFLLPAIIELGRARGRLRQPPGTATWPQIHQGLVIFALVNTLLVFASGEDTKTALLIAALGSAGIIFGAHLLQQEQDAPPDGASA